MTTHTPAVAAEPTPGPWTAEPMWGDFYVLAASGGMVADHHADSSPPDSIARMRGVGHGRTLEERHANAHLIAAAPDLLAACEALLADSDPEWEGVRPPAVVMLMRAAVAKARALPAPEALQAQPQCVHGERVVRDGRTRTCPLHRSGPLGEECQSNTIAGSVWYTYVCNGALEEQKGSGE